MQGNRCYGIKAIRHKVLFHVIVAITSIFISFLIFGVFGTVWGDEYELLNKHINSNDSTVLLTNKEVFNISIIIAVQRILVFILPAIIHFIIWLIFQKKHKYSVGFKNAIQTLIYIESIVLFSYSVFSAIHYLTAAEYWLEMANPYSNGEIFTFISSIILARIFNKSIISTDDEEIQKKLFLQK